jgi:hypothetical protein
MWLPISIALFAQVLLVGGVLGHVLGLWDLNDPPGQGLGPPPVERPQLVRAPLTRPEREDDAA